MLNLHARSFLRRIRRDWEIYSLKLITLSVALATAIVIIPFGISEFSETNDLEDDLFRVLRRNETKEYEGRNRLSDRIPVEVFAEIKKATSLFNVDTLEIRQHDPSFFRVYTRLVDEDHVEEAEVYLNRLVSDSSYTYHLQPVNEIYFGPGVIGENIRHGNIYCIIILACISGLIIILAITNYVNLSSLTLPARSKELAIRKVAGAERSPLLRMIAKESGAIVLISLLIGIGLFVMVPLPVTVDIPFNAAFIIFILCAITCVAPMIPAWAFVKATPSRLLSSDTITFPRMKNVITVVQLGVSISLIIASLVINRQISRSLIKEPGKNHDQVIYMRYPPGLSKQGLSRLQAEWPRNNPNIVELTAVSHTPDNLTSRPVGEDYYRLNVDFAFKDFFDLELASGRWFSVNDNDSVVVNEAFRGRDSTCIGVVKNFADTYNLPDKPVRITIDKDEYNFLMIRVLEVNIRTTLKVVGEFAGPGATISFLDKNYEETLAYEDRLNELSSLLAIVSIVMAACAIYALSLSRMRDNLKQIAIRKTFGATNGQIVQRQTWQFLELMLGSLFFFGPFTYFLLREWLRNFAYSAKFAWADPVIAIGICLLIVLITNFSMIVRINTHALKDSLQR